MQGSLPNIRRIPEVLQAHAPGLAEELAIFLAGQAPVAAEGGGAFRDSISGESENNGDGATVRVVSSDPKAPVIIEPTSPHEIIGNPVLHFNWQGAERFFRSVHHPGTVGWGVQVEAMQEHLMQMVDDEIGVVLAEAVGS